MFDDIGGKMKTLARIVAIIGIVLSCVGGFYCMMRGDDFGFIIGLIVAAVGSLASWLGSFALYGFGQLIENSDTLVYMAKKDIEPKHLLKTVKPAPAPQSTNFAGWTCSHCGATNKNGTQCEMCGKSRT